MPRSLSLALQHGYFTNQLQRRPTDTTDTHEHPRTPTGLPRILTDTDGESRRVPPGAGSPLQVPSGGYPGGYPWGYPWGDSGVFPRVSLSISPVAPLGYPSGYVKSKGIPQGIAPGMPLGSLWGIPWGIRLGTPLEACATPHYSILSSLVGGSCLLSPMASAQAREGGGGFRVWEI